MELQPFLGLGNKNGVQYEATGWWKMRIFVQGAGRKVRVFLRMVANPCENFAKPVIGLGVMQNGFDAVKRIGGAHYQHRC